MAQQPEIPESGQAQTFPKYHLISRQLYGHLGTIKRMLIQLSVCTWLIADESKWAVILLLAREGLSDFLDKSKVKNPLD